MNRRVVITGASSITPIGRTEGQIMENLLAGVSGVRPLRQDDLLAGRLHCGVFGTVPDAIEYDFCELVPASISACCSTAWRPMRGCRRGWSGSSSSAMTC